MIARLSSKAGISRKTLASPSTSSEADVIVSTLSLTLEVASDSAKAPSSQKVTIKKDAKTANDDGAAAVQAEMDEAVRAEWMDTLKSEQLDAPKAEKAVAKAERAVARAERAAAKAEREAQARATRGNAATAKVDRTVVSCVCVFLKLLGPRHPAPVLRALVSPRGTRLGAYKGG